MIIDNFVTQFKLDKDKEDFLKKHIIDKYIPYAEKMAYCQKIIEGSSYLPVNEEGRKLFSVNTPLRFVLYSMTLISLYTDIEIDFSNTLVCFDKLNEINAVNGLLSVIPENEYNEFSTILSMTSDDFNENNRSIIGYFDTKIEALKIMLGSLSDVINEESLKSLLSQTATEE